MQLSIIFVNYQSEELLLNCFQSIYQYTTGVDFECIVVDNKYQAGANEAILEAFPQTKWIDLGYNAGFSKANNAGLAVAQGTHVLFMNADTLVSDNAIGKAYEYLTQKPEIAAVGAIQVDAKGEPIPYYRTLNDIRIDLYILPNIPAWKRFVYDCFPKYVPEQSYETNNLVGFFLMTSKTVIQQVGAWDEDFFMYAEDAEWSTRLIKAGKLAYFENIRVIHLLGDNPFRRAKTSWVNRFSVQIQVSNLLWIRKSYGVAAYLIILLNYALLVPLFWTWKIMLNLLKMRSLTHNTENQLLFTQKTRMLFRYFWQTIFLQKKSYQIKAEENIQ
ncbi:glycosyltransferase family 2 protein [Aquirufa sp. OSTEICH-129A]